MEKVKVLWSSPNTDGLTAAAKNEIVRGLSDAGAQVDEIQLNSRKLEHCKACGNGWGTCNKSGTCVIRDDFCNGTRYVVRSNECMVLVRM